MTGVALRRPAGPRFEPTRWAAWAFSALAAGTLLAMAVLFAVQSLPAWRHEGLGYLTGTTWFYRGELFGALPMIYGTVVVAAIALVLATPVALGAALFTGEFLGGRRRLWIKIPVELLAGVPSVVYGLLGLLLLREWIYRLLEPWDPLSGDTLLTGGVLLAVMILPTVMTLADDALRGVPASQRKAARGLGLTATEVAWRVSLPAARPGLVAAILLGLGRALGETIAVFLVIGRQDNRWPEPLWSLAPVTGAGQTLTTKLGGSETWIAYGDPLHWGAMVGLAVILLALVLSLSLAGGSLALAGRKGA
ncbi:MAG: phosphate ABC transporter permease subunit PstC [Thermoanaerobaculia bacterium]|nr:phosphate ABC transporter permease subunit PstC [Thermoanaerobaculia bacterium]